MYLYCTTTRSKQLRGPPFHILFPLSNHIVLTKFLPKGTGESPAAQITRSAPLMTVLTLLVTHLNAGHVTENMLKVNGHENPIQLINQLINQSINQLNASKGSIKSKMGKVVKDCTCLWASSGLHFASFNAALTKLLGEANMQGPENTCANFTVKLWRWKLPYLGRGGVNLLSKYSVHQTMSILKSSPYTRVPDILLEKMLDRLYPWPET